MASPPRAEVASLATGTLGGALLLVAAFLPWSGRGAGSTIALRRVADLVLSGTVDAFVPRWAGLAAYGVPLGGALVVVGTGLGGRAGPRLALGGVAVAAVGTALALIALDRLPRSGVGGGTVVACAGALLGTIGVGAGRRAARRTPSPRADRPQRTDAR